MGTGKKEVARKERQGKVSDGMANVRTKGENFYRSAKKAKTLAMFTGGNAQFNAAGKLTKAAQYQSNTLPKARVESNRKWHTNTRVISQDSLESFRNAVNTRTADPYSFLLKTNKLPLSLIQDPVGKNGLKQHQAKVAVEASSFQDTFGPKAQRKRVKTAVGSLEDLAEEACKMHDAHQTKVELAQSASGTVQEEQVGEGMPEQEATAAAKEPIFSKGKSKRIWNELYKVIDASDVLIHVLDARDPLGTRCKSVEEYLRKEAPHKHLIWVLNKCDLVPTKTAATWVRVLSKEYPTLAFHASINNSFGKGSLIQLLRQFSSLHSARKQISVGLIGYPNVGKSSVINALRKKKVCTVAPLPGETKIWKYIALMKRIYLIDCPGIVPPNTNDTEEDILLKGVVRVEALDNPAQYVEAVLKRVKPKHIERTYGIKGHADATEFLELLARKGGRLLKGGEADVDGVARIVLNDFLRGKLPWFTEPPMVEGAEAESTTKDENPVESGVGLEGRRGALGEMRNRKRKRDPMEEEALEVEEERYDEDDEEDVKVGKQLAEDDGSSDEHEERDDGSEPERNTER